MKSMMSLFHHNIKVIVVHSQLFMSKEMTLLSELTRPKRETWGPNLMAKVTVATPDGMFCKRGCCDGGYFGPVILLCVMHWVRQPNCIKHRPVLFWILQN